MVMEETTTTGMIETPITIIIKEITIVTIGEIQEVLDRLIREEELLI